MKKILIMIAAMLAALSFALGAGCNGCSKTPSEQDEKIDFELIVSSIIIEKGESRRIRTNYTGDEQFTYQSSDESIVTVTSDGIVKGVKEGSATVDVTLKKLTKKFTVAVKEGESPTLRVTNIRSASGEKLIVNGTYEVKSELLFKGKAITDGVTFEYSVSGDGVLTNDKNVVTAKAVGKGALIITAKYLDYEVSETVAFTVMENVSVMMPVKAVELNLNDKTTYDAAGVYAVKDGERLNKPFTWSSSDENVVTVSESGVITAVGKGEARVYAAIEENGLKYNAYVTVTVKGNQLASPENLRVVNAAGNPNELDNEKYFKWDGVDGADYYTVTVERKQYTVRADEELSVDITESVGHTYLTVTAHSDDVTIEPSEVAEKNNYFKTASLERKAVAKHYSLDAKTITIQDYYTDENIYYADCNNKDYSILGYAFLKIYYTKNASSFSSLWWLNGSLIDYTEDLARYDGKVITMWVYSNDAITVSDLIYIPDTRKSLQSYDIPAREWTKVSFSINRGNYKFLAGIITTGNFYYTDLRVSDVDYAGKDYAKCSFYPGLGIEEKLSAFAAKYPAGSTVNELAYTDIAIIDKLFNSLPDDRRAEIVASADYKLYSAVRETFLAKYVVIDDMTDPTELLPYDNNKDTGFKVNVEFTHPKLLALSNNLKDETYGTYLNFNLSKVDGSWKIGNITYTHAALSYNLEAKKELLSDCDSVCFYIYNDMKKDKNFLANFGGTTVDGYGGIKLKAGEWTKITVSKADFLSGNMFGVSWACEGDGYYNFKVSTIFGVKKQDLYYDSDIFGFNPNTISDIFYDSDIYERKV